MLRHGLIFAALLLLVLVTGGAARGDAAGERLDAQRELFLEARAALERRDTQRFRELAGQLQDYPLYAYLDYQDLRARIRRAGVGEINRFLERWADQPVSKRLRRAWLYSLAKEGRWDQFLEYFQGGGTELQCHALHARLETGDTKNIAADIVPLWKVGKSQPDACDPAFAYLYENDLVNDALRMERIRLAMANNQPALAGWLARGLPERDRAWIALWREAHTNPSSTLKNPRLNMNKEIVRDIILHALKRLARFDPRQAHFRWEALKGGYSFTDGQRGTIERYIALVAAQSHLPEAYDWLVALPEDRQDQRIREWQVRSAILAGDWAAAIERIEAMAPEDRGADEWRYWYAVAEERGTGELPPTGLYATLARERSYHGFLAADRLDLPYTMSNRPLEVDAAALAALAKRPALVRARELFLAGLAIDARREWIYATQDMTADELKLAAALASRWGWYDRAILTVARARDFDDLVLRFPLDYREPVERHAQRNDLEPGYVFAVIRQESAFARDARSPAGARGLMQLMPATGKITAKKNRVRWTGTGGLYDVDRNIRLGTAYLREMLDRYGNNRILASASYNAGPHRVRRWLPDADSRPAADWVAAIPYRETRKYVQRVLAYNAIYDWRLELPPVRLSARMPAVLTEDRYDRPSSRGP